MSPSRSSLLPSGTDELKRRRSSATSGSPRGTSGKKGKKQKVKWTDEATRVLLDLLGASTECQSLKETNQNKKLGKVYARFAVTFNRSGPVSPFTGPKVAAKIKNLNSAWRSVDEPQGGEKNSSTPTATRGSYCLATAPGRSAPAGEGGGGGGVQQHPGEHQLRRLPGNHNA